MELLSQLTWNAAAISNHSCNQLIAPTGVQNMISNQYTRWQQLVDVLWVYPI